MSLRLTLKLEAWLCRYATLHAIYNLALTPNKVKSIGYKWVFAIKRNKKNEIVRYKAKLVAQAFSQIPGVNYEETYSPIVDATTLIFLISLENVERLQMRLMDVVTAYLYGSLNSDSYMKILEGLKMPEACFTIIAVYVDDLNIIENLDEIVNTANLLKNEFKMKDFAHPLSSPMVSRLLDRELDPFCPKEHDEDILGPEIPYITTIGVLMYLASNARPEILHFQ
ncbi:copia protein [Tanacetum coccineum]